MLTVIEHVVAGRRSWAMSSEGFVKQMYSDSATSTALGRLGLPIRDATDLGDISEGEDVLEAISAYEHSAKGTVLLEWQEEICRGRFRWAIIRWRCLMTCSTSKCLQVRFPAKQYTQRLNQERFTEKTYDRVDDS